MPTMFQILTEGQTTGNIRTLESGAYARDVAQLTRNEDFRKMIAEIPKDFQYPETMTAWELSRILQNETRNRGIGYMAIGSPARAAYKVLAETELNKEPAKLTKAQMREALRAHPDFLYTSRPDGTEASARYVFTDKVCLNVEEAFSYLQTLPAPADK